MADGYPPIPCPGRVGVATETTGVANDWADWELFILWLMEGMLFLAPGGMRTRRSGLRLFMPRFMGGGDLACMFLFMPPGETSRPGELRWFPYPLPALVPAPVVRSAPMRPPALGGLCVTPGDMLFLCRVW